MLSFTSLLNDEMYSQQAQQRSQEKCRNIEMLCGPNSLLQSLEPAPSTLDIHEKQIKPRRPPPVLEKKSREELRNIIMSKSSSTISPMRETKTTNSTPLKDAPLYQRDIRDCSSTSSADAVSESGFVKEGIVRETRDSKRIIVGEIYSASEYQNKLDSIPTSNSSAPSTFSPISSAGKELPFHEASQTDCHKSCSLPTPSISYRHGTNPTSNCPAFPNAVDASPLQLLRQSSVLHPSTYVGQPSSAYAPDYSSSGLPTHTLPQSNFQFNPVCCSPAFTSSSNSSVPVHPLPANVFPNHFLPQYPNYYRYPPLTYNQSHSHQIPNYAGTVPIACNYIPALKIPPCCSSYNPSSSQPQVRNNNETSFNLAQHKDNRIANKSAHTLPPNINPFLPSYDYVGTPSYPPPYSQNEIYKQSVPHNPNILSPIHHSFYPDTGSQVPSKRIPVPSPSAHIENRSFVDTVGQPRTVPEPTRTNVTQVTNQMIDHPLPSSFAGLPPSNEGSLIRSEAEYRSCGDGSVKLVPLNLKSSNQGTDVPTNTHDIQMQAEYWQHYNFIRQHPIRIQQYRYWQAIQLEQRQILEKQNETFANKKQSQTQNFRRYEDNPNPSNNKQNTTKKRPASPASKQDTIEKRKKVAMGRSAAKTKKDTLTSVVDNKHKTDSAATKQKSKTKKGTQSKDIIKDAPGGLHALNGKPAGVNGEDLQKKMIAPQGQQKNVTQKLYEQNRTQHTDSQDRLIQHGLNHQQQVSNQPKKPDRQQSRNQQDQQLMYQQKLQQDQQRLYQQQHLHLQQQSYQQQHLQDQQHNPLSLQPGQQQPKKQYQQSGEFQNNCQPKEKATDLVTQHTKPQTFAIKERLSNTSHGEKLSSSCVPDLPSFSAPNVIPSPCNPELKLCEDRVGGQSHSSSQCQNNSVVESLKRHLSRGKVDITSCNNTVNRSKQNVQENVALASSNGNNDNAGGYNNNANNTNNNNNKQNTTKKRQASSASKQDTIEKRKKVAMGRSAAKTKKDTLTSVMDNKHKTDSAATKQKSKTKKGTQSKDIIKDGPGSLHALAGKPAGVNGEDLRKRMIASQGQQENSTQKLYKQNRTQHTDSQDRLIQHGFNHQQQVSNQPKNPDRQQSKNQQDQQLMYQQKPQQDQQQSYQQQHLHVQQQSYQQQHLQDQQHNPLSLQLEQQHPKKQYQQSGEFQNNCQPKEEATDLVIQHTKPQTFGIKERLCNTSHGEKLSSSCVPDLPSSTTTMPSAPNVIPSPCNPELTLCEGRVGGQSPSSSQSQNNSAVKSPKRHLSSGKVDITSCNNTLSRPKQNVQENIALASSNRNNNNAKLTPKDLVLLQCSWNESSDFTIRNGKEDHSTLPHDKGAKKEPNSDEECEFELDTTQVETMLSQTIHNVNLKDDTMPYYYNLVLSPISADENSNHSEDFIMKYELYPEESLFQEASTVEQSRMNACLTPSPSPPNQFSALHLYQLLSHDLPRSTDQTHLQSPLTVSSTLAFSKEHPISSAMLSPVSPVGSCDSFTNRSFLSSTRDGTSEEQVVTYEDIIVHNVKKNN